MIFKLARNRDRDSKDTTQTSAMKRSDETLFTELKYMLGIWDDHFKDSTIKPEQECEIYIPHSVRRELEVRTITEKEVEKAVKKMRTGKDELSVEIMKASELVGIKWLTRLYNMFFATGEIPTCGEEE